MDGGTKGKEFKIFYSSLHRAASGCRVVALGKKERAYCSRQTCAGLQPKVAQLPWVAETMTINPNAVASLERRNSVGVVNVLWLNQASPGCAGQPWAEGHCPVGTVT